MIRNLVFFLTVIVFSCSSLGENINITQHSLNKPLKLVLNNRFKDSSYIYLCFPKTIQIENSGKTKNMIHNFHLGKHHKGNSAKYYKAYEYDKKLTPKIKRFIEKERKLSIQIYYGYLLKISNHRLDTFIKNKTENQILQGFKVYDIPINNTVKKWALSKINDSIKGLG